MPTKLFALLAAGIGPGALHRDKLDCENEGKKMMVTVCYPRQVYLDFVNRSPRTDPSLDQFEQHLESCHLCQQAVREAEQDKRRRKPGWC